jgi:hypothetical protein
MATTSRHRGDARRAPAVVALSVAALAVGGAALGQEAQERPDLGGVWTVKFERQPSGQALIDELPDDAVLIDDAGGGELAAGDYAGLKLSESAREQIRNYDYQAELERQNTCVTPSVAFYMQAPFPMQIHEGRDLIVLQMEYFDMYRVIHLDETSIRRPMHLISSPAIPSGIGRETRSSWTRRTSRRRPS